MSSKKSTRGQVPAVVDILGFRMAAGEYQEGEVLPVEQDLADSLEVGRNALREAVKVLSGKGLISTAPRSGTKVRPRGEWNMLDPDVLRWHSDPDIATEKFMLDLIEMRGIIEPKAAELAAVRATKEDVATILSAYDTMAGSGEDRQARLDADILFHSAILKASHNEVLNHFKYAIAAYLKAHFRRGGAVSDEIDQKDLERHRQIAWAIAARKVKSAYSLTVEMLDSNHSHFSRDE
ncbi:MAG: FadR family transcriptional regulator [Gammaproteobacteria bacterium]|jgi:DNA-binding FadR family transcriptional regulator|nr:FadR family transcriptional regulator [Gammaproteobacteria bacterium]MBT4379387.1 FadR family transcriptional regulator [Gammaproteobacteria bacterium]MBT4615222.1 FadR family transcriptional regulator [Gammaproteobacteria bacterium]MBT5197375.1 FadR family transcriptional regulator [Gammaproteobacteria bacterium]MBT5443545.1 FadR family transcriptional regulator [Gammaproteobacteria bacterium]